MASERATVVVKVTLQLDDGQADAGALWPLLWETWHRAARDAFGVSVFRVEMLHCDSSSVLASLRPASEETGNV